MAPNPLNDRGVVADLTAPDGLTLGLGTEWQVVLVEGFWGGVLR
ncbi:hypothetical protein [Nocardia testacea]